MYYHHVMLILTCWMCSKYYLESYIALLLMSSNSVVHGVKYVYYGTSVLFQLSGMWTQHVFRQILKLLALVSSEPLRIFLPTVLSSRSFCLYRFTGTVRSFITLCWISTNSRRQRCRRNAYIDSRQFDDDSLHSRQILNKTITYAP